MVEKYVGQTVQIFYQDRNRNISIRNIRVTSVCDDRVKAYCYTAQAPRVFNVKNIIDVEPVRHVG